jgi:hypothetical protein
MLQSLFTGIVVTSEITLFDAITAVAKKLHDGHADQRIAVEDEVRS